MVTDILSSCWSLLKQFKDYAWINQSSYIKQQAQMIWIDNSITII